MNEHLKVRKYEIEPTTLFILIIKKYFMNKEIRITLTPSEMESIEKIKTFFNERTKKKALARVIENFIRINNL